MVELTEIARTCEQDLTSVLNKVQGLDDLLVVQLNGVLDVDTVPKIRYFLRENIYSYNSENNGSTSESPSLIVDLTGCTFIDASFLEIMGLMRKKTYEDKKYFGAVSSDLRIKKIFVITGLSRIVNIYETFDDAVAVYQVYASNGLVSW